MCVITAPRADPQIIPLNEVTKEWLQGAAENLRLAAHRSRDRLDRRGARKRPSEGAPSQYSNEYNIRADIWRRVIQPLLDFLRWEVSWRLIIIFSIVENIDQWA
jgi:hypothetical protein